MVTDPNVGPICSAYGEFKKKKMDDPAYKMLKYPHTKKKKKMDDPAY